MDEVERLCEVMHNAFIAYCEEHPCPRNENPVKRWDKVHPWDKGAYRSAVVALVNELTTQPIIVEARDE